MITMAILTILVKSQNVAKEINDAGGSAIAVPGDMLNDAYLEELVKKTAQFGNGKIHIIVNNAGFTWDGVIHKVLLISQYCNILTRNRPQISNGIPSSLSTAQLHSSSSAPLHHTSVSRTANRATLSIFPPPLVFTVTQDRPTMLSPRPVSLV
jgi:short chain dehydrogenase